MLVIDGSYGEGGGQIIRTAMTLSALTQKPITIKNIRPRRTKAGLQPQHLTACHAVKTICDGNLTAELQSTTLSFTPQKIKNGDYEFNVGTAGAIMLVAQTILPLLLCAPKPSIVRIIGGTHVRNSPSYDYFKYVFLPAINKLGADVHIELKRLGFFPRGGGIIEMKVNPSKLFGNTDWKKSDSKIYSIIRLANLYPNIADREKLTLQQHNIHEIDIDHAQADSPGNAVTLWQGFNGSTALGERGKLAEKVAEEAVQQLQPETEEVDRHLADQLLIYSVLATGKTCYRTSKITDHLKTNIYIISLFIERKMLVNDLQICVEN